MLLTMKIVQSLIDDGLLSEHYLKRIEQHLNGTNDEFDIGPVEVCENGDVYTHGYGGTAFHQAYAIDMIEVVA